MNGTASQLDLADLGSRVTGRVLDPADPDYGQLATPWNVAQCSAPLAVVEVTTAEDVSAVVRYAAETGVDVAVQATGHGALAFTRPTLLVHTGLLNEITVRKDGSARIGAGVRWAAVLEAGAPLGLAGLAGSAPTVGVVGYATGGGLGPVARTFGFASDHVTAFDVVTGDGEIRRATPTEQPDLFWGLRGGKGTLGIVTAVEMQLMPIAEIYGGCLYFSSEDLPTVMHAWQQWSRDLPEQASTSIAILRLPPLDTVPPPLAGEVAVAVRYAWVGDAEQGKAVFAPMQAVAPSVLGSIGVMPYAAIGSIHNDPVDPMPIHEASTLLRTLPPAAVDVILASAGPDSSCPQVIVELRLLGGAVAQGPEHPSAVSHRDAAYSLITIGIAAPPVAGAAADHSAALLEALAPWSTGHRLPNFGASAQAADVARAYDAPTVARLSALARTHDPRRVLTAARPLLEVADSAAEESFRQP